MAEYEVVTKKDFSRLQVSRQNGTLLNLAIGRLRRSKREERAGGIFLVYKVDNSHGLYIGDLVYGVDQDSKTGARWVFQPDVDDVIEIGIPDRVIKKFARQSEPDVVKPKQRVKILGEME